MTPTKTTPGNPQTIAGGKVAKHHSKFNLSYPVLATMRFGEYTPHFFAETVPNDSNILLRSSHSLRSYTLKSPLLNNVKIRKDYFNVPLQAIIPYNYEKFKTNPVQGDDCPDDAGTTLHDFVHDIYIFVSNHKPTSFGSTSADYLAFFRFFVALQWFYSNGSLLSCCEARLGNRLHIEVDYQGSTKSFSVDEFTDLIFTSFADWLSTSDNSFLVNFGSQIYRVFASVAPDSDDFSRISLREFFYRFMQQPYALFSAIPDDLSTILTDFDFNTLSIREFDSDPDKLKGLSCDLRRLHAYNIACSHFYSNDHIDYIYTAQLYRQNQWALATANPNLSTTFTMNGVSYQYDALSAHIVSQILTYNSSTYSNQEFAYLANIFNFNRSLRFMDYFSGARSQPLAVGNTNVPVVGSNVNVVDMTRGLQRQRFLNAVNRSGSRFESYIKNLFGVKPAYDFHNPFYLGSTADDVHTTETQNTGGAQFEEATNLDFSTRQNSVTSNFMSQSDRFAFNFDSDRDSVIVGITYFDIPRFYPYGVPKVMQHENRFDDFIPQAQFIGDQPITNYELGDPVSAANTFGYTGRYQEYKMRVPYCYGGVAHYLRTWSYLPNRMDIARPISPDFIRSFCSELDKFYLQLSNYSLAGYFHFIVLSNNQCEGTRPMVKHPTIL